MRYDIRLRIDYHYDSPADVGRHLLRLEPADIPEVQQVIARTVTCHPTPAEMLRRRDFFGTGVVEIGYAEPQERTRFEMRATVERRAAEPGLDMSPALDDLARELSGDFAIDAASPQHFRATSPRVPHSAAVADWAARRAKGAGSAYALALALMRALNREMAFDNSSTLVDTPLEQAFAQRSGVCQDYSHILICALRGMGIPAGYVSGYLRTRPPEGQARLEGADAMHAWVRAWMGRRMGWIELDPTNDMIAGADHVVIGYGRDYFDVSPVKGALRIAGGQYTTQAVDVVEAEPPRAEPPRASAASEAQAQMQPGAPRGGR